MTLARKCLDSGGLVVYLSINENQKKAIGNSRNFDYAPFFQVKTIVKCLRHLSVIGFK